MDSCVFRERQEEQWIHFSMRSLLKFSKNQHDLLHDRHVTVFTLHVHQQGVGFEVGIPRKAQVDPLF